jgi:hypothetical protein
MSATDISGGSVWIEKILIRTEIQTNLDDILKRNDPLGGLLRSIQRLRSDDEGLADLMKEFSEFKRRLPPELQYGDDAIDLDDSGTRREMIDEVKQILIGRLLSKGSPE